MTANTVSATAQSTFADYRQGDVKDWKQPQRKAEGRGWTKDSVTDNTYTGPGGSKRD